MEITFTNHRGNPELARVIEKGDAYFVHLPGERQAARAIVIGRPPAGVDENLSSWAFVVAGVCTVLTLADKTDAVTGDELLSALGKTNKLSPDRTRAILVVRNVVESATRAQASAGAALSALFEYPAIGGSPVEIAADREVRDRWHALGDEDKGKLLAEVLSDPLKHERVALALARSPWPLRYGKADEAIRQARETSVRSLQPLTVAKADLDLEAANWAAGTMPAIAGACAQVVNLPRETLFDLVDGADAAPDYVLTAFGFRNPSEVVMLRNRRANAA